MEQVSSGFLGVYLPGAGVSLDDVHNDCLIEVEKPVCFLEAGVVGFFRRLYVPLPGPGVSWSNGNSLPTYLFLHKFFPPITEAGTCGRRKPSLGK